MSPYQITSDDAMIYLDNSFDFTSVKFMMFKFPYSGTLSLPELISPSPKHRFLRPLTANYYVSSFGLYVKS